MINSAFSDLAQCTDIASLRPALMALCSEFGSVSRLHILATADRGKRAAVCFVRLASPEQESMMMARLGVQRYGNEMFMVLDLAN